MKFERPGLGDGGDPQAGLTIRRTGPLRGPAVSAGGSPTPAQPPGDAPRREDSLSTPRRMARWPASRRAWTEAMADRPETRPFRRRSSRDERRSGPDRAGLSGAPRARSDGPAPARRLPGRAARGPVERDATSLGATARIARDILRTREAGRAPAGDASGKGARERRLAPAAHRCTPARIRRPVYRASRIRRDFLPSRRAARRSAWSTRRTAMVRSARRSALTCDEDSSGGNLSAASRWRFRTAARGFARTLADATGTREPDTFAAGLAARPTLRPFCAIT